MPDNSEVQSKWVKPELIRLEDEATDGKSTSKLENPGKGTGPGGVS